ncbi:hypothetical protein Agabi119p4_5196 [Agaricus bisporus var. burnettii]|uniref:F-box domain-containing protein n=1 Tax=Agaricus bisporus var. burnettii TaxID=192524 RepID=A0A8H7F4S1_AGABI|nr:hypothetical protein Agabi119p4_5196 [Agaricus bisporus var. burnettii]
MTFKRVGRDSSKSPIPFKPPWTLSFHLFSLSQHHLKSVLIPNHVRRPQTLELSDRVVPETRNIQISPRRSIIHESYRLPPELWIEIFSHCLADFPRIDSCQIPSTTLASVCKAWNHLVMTTPRFWSKFEIVYEDLNHSQVQQDDIMRTLQLWLRRSRQHPLSFRLIHKYAGSPTNPVGSTRYLTTLVSHASRWQNVQFHGPSESLVLLPSQLPNGKLPTLRSLSFHVNGSAGFPFDVASLNIPWSQLSGLDLQIYQDNAHSLNECFTFLSSARNLTCVALNATFPFTLGGHLETITLPYLRSFKLSIQGSDSEGTAELSLRDFLEHVSIPNLTTFSLEWQDPR